MTPAAIAQAPQTTPSPTVPKTGKPGHGFGKVLDGKAPQAAPPADAAKGAAPDVFQPAVTAGEGETAETGWAAQSRAGGMSRGLGGGAPETAAEHTDERPQEGKKAGSNGRNTAHLFRAASPMAVLRGLVDGQAGGAGSGLDARAETQIAGAGTASSSEAAGDLAEEEPLAEGRKEATGGEQPRQGESMVPASQLAATSSLLPVSRRLPTGTDGGDATEGEAGNRPLSDEARPSDEAGAAPAADARSADSEAKPAREAAQRPARNAVSPGEMAPRAESAATGARAGAADGGASAQAATAILKAQLSAAGTLPTAGATGSTAPRGGAVEVRESGGSGRAGATGRVRDAAASLGLFAVARRSEDAEAVREPRAARERVAAKEAAGEERVSAPVLDRQAASAESAERPAAAVAPGDFGRFLATELRGQAPAAPGSAQGAAQGAAATAPTHPALQQDQRAGVMRQLDVRLHPAELGTVTARIRMNGASIAVEIAAETPEAQHRLVAEGDTIRKALEALGFSVDALSIRLPDAAAPAGTEQPAQRDAAAQGFTGAGGQAGESGRGEDGRAGGQARRFAENRGEADAQAGRSGLGGGMARADAGGVYI